MVLMLHGTMVTVCNVRFNVKRSNTSPASIISCLFNFITNSIVQLVFMMDILCIYCAVETELCKVLLTFHASKC